MVANVRAQIKREIILEDSAILEEERRTAISFDPRNGSIVAEIGPTSSTLSCLSFPQYDTSTVLDALKNLDNPVWRFLSLWYGGHEFWYGGHEFRYGGHEFWYGGHEFRYGGHEFWDGIHELFFFVKMRVRISECMRAVNRSLSAHNLVAGIWDYGRWPHRKVVVYCFIILVRYRIRDCTPTVERAFFARWAEQGRGRVEIESAERKDRSTQLLLSESNEYVIALANVRFGSSYAAGHENG
ncbi:unnamed protein product [Toxocara canis]|uniref:Uncharacterized protein n=1 Tax=Toxocara canis TaxID=6265 RepID=A0A183V1Q1_TOXCA|nr:unnamed protein product [Toxocara canis]